MGLGLVEWWAALSPSGTSYSLGYDPLVQYDRWDPNHPQLASDNEEEEIRKACSSL